MHGQCQRQIEVWREQDGEQQRLLSFLHLPFLLLSFRPPAVLLSACGEKVAEGRMRGCL